MLANVNNHNGQLIDYIIISENNDIILLTDKQYKRLLKEKKRGIIQWNTEFTHRKT